MGLLDKLRAEQAAGRPLSLLDRLRMDTGPQQDEWEPFGHLLRNRRTGETKPAERPWWSQEPEAKPAGGPSQREERRRELEAMGALPALGREELPEDPGVWGPAARRAADAAVGWTVGIGERLGNIARSNPVLGAMGGANVLAAIEPGTRQAMRGNLDEEREAALLHGNANARALALGTSELVGGVAGSAIPGLQIGRAVSTAANVGKIANPLARVAAGAGAAGLEGAVQGAGETAGMGVRDQLKGIALGAGLAGFAGAAPGLAAHVAPHLGPLGKPLGSRGILPAGGPHADPVAGRAGRSEPGAAGAGVGGVDPGLRPGLREGAAGRPTSVATGFGDSVPLPGGPLYRGEATSADVVPTGDDAGIGSHLWGRHFTEDRDYAQLHADKYGSQGRVTEHSLELQRPFSVARNYGYDELRAIDPAAALQAAREAGITDPTQAIPGGLMQLALRNQHLDTVRASGGAVDSKAVVDAIRAAGEKIKAAGYDAYHHEVTTPRGKANAWAAFDAPAPRSGQRPRLTAAAMAAFQQERDALLESLAGSQASGQVDGQPVSPADFARIRAERLRAFETQWHQRASQMAQQTDEPALHQLAEQTERAVQEKVQAPTAAPEPISPVIRYGPDPKEPVATRLRKLADRWVDEMSNKEEAPVRFLRRAGLGGEAGHLEKLIGRARGASRIAENVIWKGVYQFDPKTNGVVRTHDSFNSIVGGLDGQAYRDLNDLMAAQHHMELVGRRDAALAEQKTMGAQGILTDPPDASLRIDPRGTAEAQRILDELGKRYGVEVDPTNGAPRVRKIGNLAGRVRSWSQAAVVDQLDALGYFTPEGKAALLGKNKEYAPFFRLIDDLEGDPVLAGGNAAQPLKRISGGLSPDKPIAPPAESFVAQAQRVAVWAERQRVRNMLGELADANPDTIGKDIKRVGSGKGAFQAYRDGQRIDYSAPADVMASLERLPPKQANMFMQAATLASRFLRAGATLTPDFAVRNFLRDQATAGTYGSEFGYRPFADFAVGLWAQTPFGGALKDFATKWEASGGALSDYISVERPQAQRTAEAASGLVRLPFLEKPVKAPRLARTWSDWKAEKGLLAKIAFPVLRPLEAASGAVEQATRIGAFRKAKMRGADDLTAGNFSRNIGLDFGRSGSFAQRWNSVEAFANASLQDVARFSRAMREKPVATSLAASAYITAPALAMWAMNKDDPDYQSLPEWEKASFLHLAKREDGRWIRFPRPLGMLNLVYGYGLQKMLEQAIGEGHEEPVNDLLATVFNETPMRFSPVQPDPSPEGDIRGSFEALPSIAQPAVEAAAGPGGWSSFREGPIVPRGMQEGTLPRDRALDSTSATARAVGGALGVAPLKVDHLIRGYGAGLTVAALQAAEGALGVGPTNDLPSTAKDIPGVGGLVSSSPYGFASQPVQDLYSLEKAAANAAGSLRAARDGGRTQEYHRILREHPEALVADQLADVRRQLTDLRNARKLYRSAPGMTPENRAEALLQIDQAATQIAAGHMHMISDFLRGQRD